MHVERGGDGGPVLLLLHGLGATGEVWRGLTELLPGRWPGSWVVPDLPGHGRSPALEEYTFAGLAAAVAPVVGPGQPVVALGHSLGGVVALALATGPAGLDVQAVGGLGIKVAWSATDLAKAAELAARPNKVFATAAEAEERALRVAGLTGLAEPGSGVAAAAVKEVEGGYTLALDPRAFAVGEPDMRLLVRLAARAGITVSLAAGEGDDMCLPEDLDRLVPDGVILPGLDHNAHVESPADVLDWLEESLLPLP